MAVSVKSSKTTSKAFKAWLKASDWIITEDPKKKNEYNSAAKPKRMSSRELMEFRRVPKTKICKACGEELPAKAFNLAPSNKDGLQCYCRECYHARQKAKQDRIKEEIKQFG